MAEAHYHHIADLILQILPLTIFADSAQHVISTFVTAGYKHHWGVCWGSLCLEQE